MWENSSVASGPRVRSFIVLIVHSALLTCSLAAVVLHSRLGSRGQIFSNSPSIKIVLTANPARLYTSNTQVMCLLRFVAVLTGTCSAVTNFIRRATVVKNGVPSTKNTSAESVMILFVSTSNHGTDTYSATTGAGVHCTVFPLTLARSGPKMAQALDTSDVEIGQFLSYYCSPSFDSPSRLGSRVAPVLDALPWHLAPPTSCTLHNLRAPSAQRKTQPGLSCCHPPLSSPPAA